MKRSVCLLLALFGCASNDTVITKQPRLLGVSPSLQDAGSLEVGETATVAFSLEWKQGDDIDIVDVTITAHDGDFFTTTAATPFTVAKNGTGELEVVYAPTEAGFHTAQIEISTNEEGDDSHIVEVRGRASVPDLQVYPAILDFGPVAVGDSGAGAVTVQNNGAFPVEVESASSGDAAFAVLTGTPFTVPAQSSLDLQLAFTPTTTDAAATTITLGLGSSGATDIAVRGNDCPHGEAALFDADGDGFTTCGGDCDDSTDTIQPLAAETCDGVDQDCDGVVDNGTTCSDDDADGFSDDEGDCQDDNAEIGPGIAELYDDGIDNDCDGIVDYGTSDADHDGWAPEGGDCDDTAASVHPGAPETADGVDEDCDGAVDEGTVHVDDDADGTSEDAGDCDDGDASVSPGAAESGNGRDDDCDGAVDEGTERADDDGDGFTEAGGDCDDDDAAVSPAALEIAGNGMDDDCDGASE